MAQGADGRKPLALAKILIGRATWTIGVVPAVGIARIGRRWPSESRPSAQATPFVNFKKGIK